MKQPILPRLNSTGFRLFEKHLLCRQANTLGSHRIELKKPVFTSNQKACEYGLLLLHLLVRIISIIFKLTYLKDLCFKENFHYC